MNQHKDLPPNSQSWAKEVDTLMETVKRQDEIIRRLAANAGIDYSNPQRGLNTGDTPSVNNPVGQKLSSLADVKVYNVLDGQVPTWSQSGQAWLPVTPAPGGAAVPIPDAIVYYGDSGVFMGIGDWPNIPGNVWAFSANAADGTWQAQGTQSVNLLAGRWNAAGGTLMSFEMVEQTSGRAEVNLVLEDYDSGTQTGMAVLATRIAFYGAAVFLPTFTTASRPAGLTNDLSDKGAMVYDYTLNIPIWWNGTAWTNALGTAV